MSEPHRRNMGERDSDVLVRLTPIHALLISLGIIISGVVLLAEFIPVSSRVVLLSVLGVFVWLVLLYRPKSTSGSTVNAENPSPVAVPAPAKSVEAENTSQQESPTDVATAECLVSEGSIGVEVESASGQDTDNESQQVNEANATTYKHCKNSKAPNLKCNKQRKKKRKKKSRCTRIPISSNSSTESSHSNDDISIHKPVQQGAVQKKRKKKKKKLRGAQQNNLNTEHESSVDESRDFKENELARASTTLEEAVEESGVTSILLESDLSAIGSMVLSLDDHDYLQVFKPFLFGKQPPMELVKLKMHTIVMSQLRYQSKQNFQLQPVVKRFTWDKEYIDSRSTTLESYV